MKVIIMAGGYGTRLSEYTDIIPKPMVRIGEFPILHHIMQIYSYYGFKEFILSLGYKASVVRSYFLNYKAEHSNISINLNNNEVTYHDSKKLDWNIDLIDTGVDSNTGGRILSVRDYIDDDTFMATYGDGLSDIDIQDLLDFHYSHGKIATISAVRPAARFGELLINKGSVTKFKEKPQLDQGWINGGFFVFNKRVFDYIDHYSTVFEEQPLERLCADGELMAYEHRGFWMCMDTKRDKDTLNDIWTSGTAPWVRLAK